MSQKDILKTLQDTAILAIAASSLPALPYAYVGVDFNIPDDNKYAEFVFIPNDGADAYWDGKQVMQGIFRIILHWPNDGGGVYDAMTLIEEIALYFQKGVRYDGVEIYQRPKIGKSLDRKSELLYPATIRYRSFQ